MSIDTDYRVLRDVLAEHQPQGWAIEFVVYSGYSLGIIAEHMPVIGLDSFEGLPEDWRDNFPKGAFAVPQTLGFPHHPNAMIVPGLFEDTLPVLEDRGIPLLGLVHIDCDLYSSTVTALEGVREYIYPGTVVVFDEYEGDGFDDEKRAWEEFCDKYAISHDLIGEGPEEAAFVIRQIGVR